MIEQGNGTPYIITDTYGVKYVCSKSGIKRIKDGVETELVKYETESINSVQDVYNQYNIDNEYIFTVTKNSTAGNVISESEPNKTKYYIRQAYEYEHGFDKGRNWLIYSLPYKVEYPTGLTKYFEYEKQEDWETDNSMRIMLHILPIHTTPLVI